MKSQEDEFYSDLDRKTFRRSCCTLNTFFLFFLGVLIITLSGTIYCYYEIKKINLSSKIVQATFQDKNNFYEKLKIDPTEENFEIIISSEELTAVISEGISFRNFVIKNNQAIIDPNGVNFYGSLIKPLSSTVQIKTVPKVESGKIKFTVEKMTLGKLAMPKFICEDAASVLNKTMDTNFQDLYARGEVQNISLSDNKMTISGKIK